MTFASAPGKIILLGEHAVVYGRPAIAAPVWQVQATATITPQPAGRGCWLIAHDTGLRLRLAEAPADQPLAVVTRLTLAQLALPTDPDWQIELRSTIPIASGLGSGAALSAALVRALFAHVGRQPDPAQVSELVLASERFYHGTPSGIDNTVIAYGQPIWFVKGQPPAPFAPQQPLTIVIGNSGPAAPTKETVGAVRRNWQADPERYERWFDAIGTTVSAARRAIEQGTLEELGHLFDENQGLLEQLGVSSPALEQLIRAARRAGALGAKLSGGGRGGNMIALVLAEQASPVAHALTTAGAQSVVVTVI
jgi:mevalonate kinase